MFGLTQEQLIEKNAINTANEIKQQGEIWKVVFEQSVQIKKHLLQKINQLGYQRVIFLGAGSSAFIGDMVAATLREISPYKEMDFISIPTTDIVAYPQSCVKNEPTIVVSFARSGNSPESIGAIDVLSHFIDDIYCIHITCNKEGQLYLRSQQSDFEDAYLLPDQTNDKGFAMTSSVSSMYLAAIILFTAEDKFTVDYFNQLQAHFNTMLPIFETTINDIVEADNYNRVFYIGSGPLLGLAHEISLKILELSAGQTDAYYESVMGFRHGPKSLMHTQTLMIILGAASTYTKLYDQDIVNEIISNDLNNPIVTIGHFDAALSPQQTNIVLPKATDNDIVATLLLELVFGQLLSLKNSLHLNITPDNPSPDGKVNRVVQGVILHPVK